MARPKNNSQNNQPDNQPEIKPQQNSENSPEVVTASKVTEQVENEPVIKSPTKEQETDSLQSPREAEDYALSVVQSLEQRGINVSRLNININGEPVFAMKDGDIDRSRTEINGQQAELLRQALTDPASMKGSVKITQGSRVLVHIKDGRVLSDALGIVKESAKVDIKSKSPDEGSYQRYSQGVNDLGLARSQQIALNAFKDGVSREQVVEMMKNHDPDYKDLIDKSGEKTAEITVVSQAEIESVMQSQPAQTEQQSQEATVSKSRGRSR